MLGRIRLVDHRTARQYHEADNFAADQHDSERQADVIEHGAAERAVALVLVQVGALHLREHACGVGRCGRADGCQTDEYQNPQHEVMPMRRTHKFGIERFPGQEGHYGCEGFEKKGGRSGGYRRPSGLLAVGCAPIVVRLVRGLIRNRYERAFASLAGGAGYA